MTHRTCLMLALLLLPRASSAEETALPTNPRFSRHVVPILSKLGCNAGACHGAVQGQNGFRLSLFGLDPALDHSRLLRDFGGRRVNTLDADASLLLLKATGQSAHRGGVRTSLGSPEYQVLRPSFVAMGDIASMAQGLRENYLGTVYDPLYIEMGSRNPRQVDPLTQIIVLQSIKQKNLLETWNWFAAWTHNPSNSTLVMAIGEMGRTPKVNKNGPAARDHWGNSMFALLAGGGIRGGQVVGSTDAQAAYPKTAEYKIASVGKTMYHLLGINPETELHTTDNRPLKLITEDVPLIRELL